MSTASITIAGRLGRDPEQKTTNSGKSLTRFSVAVDTGWGDSKTTTWWAVTIFGKSGEAAARHLHKGAWVFVAGEPSVRTYQKRDGSQGFSADIVARDWGFVGSKSDNQSSGQSGGYSGGQRSQVGGGQSSGGQSQPYADDSIPF